MVYLVFGICLGMLSTAFEAKSWSAKAVMDIAMEAVAFRIFFLLYLLGFLGLLLTRWRRVPLIVKCVLHKTCLPTLRISLTTGFALSSITIGLGIGGFLISWCLGSSDQWVAALRLGLLGFMLLMIVWQCLYGIAKYLDVSTVWLDIVFGFCLFFEGIMLLYVSRPNSFWPVFATVCIGLLLCLWRRCRIQQQNIKSNKG